MKSTPSPGPRFLLKMLTAKRKASDLETGQRSILSSDIQTRHEQQLLVIGFICIYTKFPQSELKYFCFIKKIALNLCTHHRLQWSEQWYRSESEMLKRKEGDRGQERGFSRSRWNNSGFLHSNNNMSEGICVRSGCTVTHTRLHTSLSCHCQQH